MCKKDLISLAPNAVSLYQSCEDAAGHNETQSTNVIIQMDISATHPTLEPIKILASQVWVKIPCESFDVIARDWCKKRELNTNKFTLEELLSQCTFQWPIVEKTLIDGLDEWVEDLSLTEQVNEREQQDEKEVVLHYENIFDAVVDDEDSARLMQKSCNDLLKLREMGQRLQSAFPILSVISNEAEHKKALDTMEMLLEDYGSNLLLIDALSSAIARYEQQ
ncbi:MULTISPECIES: hypothetical protein [unclassified Alteromonas]|uniref:hypothetical protein n=1 Tax=unclassified Alteromonas TaxID=2614992 RepID=UPI0005096DB3|nr:MULTISPECIES: hypothetical protein [unclassified Alteromonas]